MTTIPAGATARLGGALADPKAGYIPLADAVRAYLTIDANHRALYYLDCSMKVVFDPNLPARAHLNASQIEMLAERLGSAGEL